MDQATIAKAKLNPTLVFHHPQELLRAEMPVEDKADVLKQWEYDLREEDVASEENMPDTHDDTAATRASLLQSIHEVRDELAIADMGDQGDSKQG